MFDLGRHALTYFLYNKIIFYQSSKNRFLSKNLKGGQRYQKSCQFSIDLKICLTPLLIAQKIATILKL